MNKIKTKKKHRPEVRVLILLSVFLIVAIVLSFLLGRYPITVKELGGLMLDRLLEGLGKLKVVKKLFPGASFSIEKFWPGTVETALFNIRLPRILLACLVGCCLSAAGASYQGVFQNPMAAPDILGATSGAAFGAALAILLGAGSKMITLSAFAFSLLSVGLVFLISKSARGKQVLTLVLSGIMIGSLFSAGTSYIKLVADPSNQLPAITYWLMGSLSGTTKRDVAFAVIPMVVGLFPLLLLRWRINILTLGDDEARTIGVSAGRVRLIVIICATLVTSASVAVTGMIGWVGLVIPHLARRLVGNDYKYLMPASMLFGAAFLLLVDDVSRNLLATEIPIGILTAFIGAPFFIWLITRRGDAF